jgi:predicted transcriptional regulator
MGNSNEGEVWITMQAHTNILAVASLKDLAGIIIIGAHKPSQAVIDKANDENIPLMLSEESAFDIGGKLYQLLKKEE